MTDPILNKWKQKGKLYLWKYKQNTQNYPGWHLNANKEGVKSLLELFGLMKDAKYSCDRTLFVDAPTRDVLSVPNNKNAAFRTVKKIQLKCFGLDHAEDNWSFILTDDKIEFEFSKSKLEVLIKGIVDISEGNGDYALEIDDKVNPIEYLWFWW
jgi:hypothetical protein